MILTYWGHIGVCVGILCSLKPRSSLCCKTFLSFLPPFDCGGYQNYSFFPFSSCGLFKGVLLKAIMSFRSQQVIAFSPVTEGASGEHSSAGKQEQVTWLWLTKGVGPERLGSTINVFTAGNAVWLWDQHWGFLSKKFWFMTIYWLSW